MRCSILTLSLLASTAAVLADLLGPRYPAPLDLTSRNSLVAAAWQNITDTFDAHLNGSAPSPLLAGVENITFSFGAFSIHDTAAAQSLQYHYTSPEIQNSSVGVNRVDGDSIYRVASVTKLVSVLVGMRELTEEQWNRPLTQVLPGLADFVARQKNGGNQAVLTQWQEATTLALASHLSGVAANVFPFTPTDLYALYEGGVLTSDPTTYGLPPLVLDQIILAAGCLVTNGSCTPDRYMADVQAQPPLFQPWTSPHYSNNGFILLGIALSNLTGKPLDQLYREAVFNPLNMTSSNISVPSNLLNRGVIAGGVVANWATDGGISRSSGGVFSTLNDLAKFSTGVLNSTLLPAAVTRKWMKPMSHTASLYYSVGAPWEILRYTHLPGQPSAGVITDLYTKLGDSGAYGGTAALIPEYGAGFNVIDAGISSSRSSVQTLVMDAIVRTLVPALEAQAAAETRMNFAGTYVSSNTTLNSSLTLVIDPLVPGLKISQWMSNGTDVLANQLSIFTNTGGLRLLPTIAEVGSSQYAFRAVKIVNQTVVDAALATGLYTGSYTATGDWILVDTVNYGGPPMDLLVFDIDGRGRASSVSMPAFRAKLTRQT